MPQLRKEDWFERYILPGLACEKGRILPINIVGQKAAEVRQTLLARDSRRQIGVLTAVTSVDDCKQWLLPHSSTMVLDPDVAKAIAHSSPLMEAVSLKTAGWLMMPLVIRPEPFLYILREPFSFEEPVADDNAENRWCWTAKADPAVVEIIHCRPEGAYRVSFVLSSQNPGNFKIELNGQGQKFSLKGKELARTCIFKISLGEGANFLRISFDGKPFPVGPGDERKQLYYCLSGLKVEANTTWKTAWLGQRTAHRAACDAFRQERMNYDFCCRMPPLYWWRTAQLLTIRKDFAATMGEDV